MTTIIGVKFDGGSLIVADTQSTSGNINFQASKIYTMNGISIAMCGYHSLSDRIFDSMSSMRQRYFDEPSDKYIKEEFIRVLRDLYLKIGIPYHDNDSKNQGVVMYCGNLYSFSSENSLYKIEKHFATGSGREVALGALSASPFKDPKQRALQAIRIASELDIYTSAPFDLVEQFEN